MTDLSLQPFTQRQDAESADRSYISLAKQIHALIAAGDFETGSRLPSERTLADKFNVSRTQVREAIIALEVQGVVEVRVGSGIYITADLGAKPVSFELPRGPGPIETLRARALIESEVAALAAVERKDSDLDRIFFALTAMRERCTTSRRMKPPTGNFTCASPKPPAIRCYCTWSPQCGTAREAIRCGKRSRNTFIRRLYASRRRKIISGFLPRSWRRDPAAARQAMQAHLVRVVSEFTQAWR